jgi:hypothetical protein
MANNQEAGTIATARFRISWSGTNYGYVVSVPNFEGGEVVMASEYDRLRQVNKLLLDAAKDMFDRLVHEAPQVSVSLGAAEAFLNLKKAILEAEKVSQ